MYRLFFVLLFLIPGVAGNRVAPALGHQRGIDREDIIDCAPPGPATMATDADGRYAPVFSGWGHYHHAVTTTSDSAQFYFDQGLSLYYSYHLTESAASFREAAARDDRCLMTYWGQALAMGPYYNSTYFYKMPQAVLPVIARMNALVAEKDGSGVKMGGSGAGAGEKEKDLVSALNARYSTDTSDSRRAELNRAYAESMLRLVAKYPDDNDVKALYIDAVMCEHAWDMWDNEGRPRPWTPELVKYCEEILAREPSHPAALHYHIHLLEASLHPEATLADADKLKDLMPGVPHMVHMASHTYQRTGLYAKGVMINDAANAAHQHFRELAPQLRLAENVIHYDAVETYCALNGAMYQKAMESAQKCWDIAVARGGVVSTNMQFLSSMRLFALVRMGKWQEILHLQAPDSRWVYANLLNDFARGMAFVQTGNIAQAEVSRDNLVERLRDPSLKTRILPFNAADHPGAVALNLLGAEMLFSRGKTVAAMEEFQRAIALEDGLAYLEPNEWPLPVRQYAGACLLRMGRPAEAEKMYREDLVRNPGNGWSLMGLAQSLEAQHKKDAADYFPRARAAFASAEVMPATSDW